MNFLFFKLAFLLSTYADLTSDELITFKESLCGELDLDIFDRKDFMERDVLRLNYCTEALCDKLSKITSLKILIVYNFDDSLQVIPNSLCNLVNLELLFLQLRMTSNITELPQKMVNLAMLKVITIEGTEIISLPESFGSLKSLIYLCMSNNKITFLPESFGSLNALSVILIYNTNIDRLPESFGSLQSLEILNMSNNKITFLPESFGSLQSLETLNMSNNKITFLPESFSSFQSLETLNMSNNKITFLPISFNKLKSVSYINLSYNSLEAWPDSEVELYKLKTLDLFENRVKRLPKKLIDFFANSERFLKLNIMNNPKFELIDTNDSYGLFSIFKILQEKVSLPKHFHHKIQRRKDRIPIKINMDVLNLFRNTYKNLFTRTAVVKFLTNRNRILEDAIVITKVMSTKKFRNYDFLIEFIGELGEDMGGLKNVWFGLVITEFIKQKNNLFNYYDLDKKCGLVPAYNERLNSQVQSPEPTIIVEEEKDILLNYRFLGIIMGMAILEKCPLNLNLHLSVYQYLLGKHVTFENIKYFDTTLHNSIEYCLKEPSEYWDQFSRIVVKNCNGKPITINIQKDGNNDGKIEDLIDLYLKYKFEYNIHEQLEALKSGFNEIIHAEEYYFLSAKELELLICGQGNIDIENLKKVATYENISKDDQLIAWFWEILSTYKSEELSKLIHFVTGSSRVGYSGLDKFVIQYDQSVKEFIPTSSTCFNMIHLCNYKSCEEMKRYLEKALEYHNEKFYIA